MPRTVALAVLGVGAAIVVAALHLSSLGRKTRSFTRTHGRVVVSRVEETPAPVEEGGTKFRAEFHYAYEVHGRSYESEQVSFGTSPGAATTDPQEARRWVERHPVGMDVEVWYDPGDPRRSVLVRGVSSAQVVLGVIVGLALVGVGLFALAR